jgi:hypothetical protein
MPAAVAEPGTTLEGIRTLRAGDHPGDEPGEVWTYSESDLAGIARTTALLLDAGLHTPPVAATHDGVEALGWVSGVRSRGEFLVTDWRDVRPKLRLAILERRFENVSAEIKPEFLAPDGTRHGPYLFRVVVLGADVPRSKGTGLEGAVWHSDAGPPARRMQGVRPMADGAPANLEDQALESLKGKGLSDDTLAIVKKDEKLLSLLVRDLTGGGAPPADAGGAAAMALVDGVEMDRQAIVDELVNAFGHDPAELDGMSDDELAALLSQERAAGGGTAPMSEPNTPDATSVTGAAGAGKGENPAPAPSVPALEAAVEAVLERKFAEKIKAIDRRLTATDRTAKAVQHNQRQASREAVRKRVYETCRGLQETGQVEPWEMDETNPGVLSLPQQLLLLDAERPLTRTFAEGGKAKTVTRTALDEAIEALKKRPARKFSERVVRQADDRPAVSPERRRELLAHTELGRAVLRAEAKK